MRLTINDIDDLVVTGGMRLDESNNYDISYYEKYIADNITIIEGLISKVKEQIDLLKNEGNKKRVIYLTKYLDKAYEKNINKQVRIEYENSPYSSNSGRGYLEIHKYAGFIAADFPSLASSYANIIEFMNNIYQQERVSEKKGDGDSSTLFGIFAITKKSCLLLGIHCPDAYTLYNAITGDPYAEKSELFDMDFEIDEENALEQDIIISSLPYTVTAPMFTWEGPGKYELPVTKPRAKIWYNKSYLDNNPTIK